METNHNEIQNNDHGIWKINKKKIAFKFYLLIYIIANTFLWMIWYMNIAKNNTGVTGSFPWPIWPTLFWGIGVLYTYFEIYKLKHPSSKLNIKNLTDQ